MGSKWIGYLVGGVLLLTSIANEIRSISVLKKGWEDARNECISEFDRTAWKITPLYELVSVVYAKDPTDSDKLYDKCEFLLLGLLIEQVMDLYLIIISIMFIVSVFLESVPLCNAFILAFLLTTILYYLVETIRINAVSEKSIPGYAYKECWAFAIQYILFWFGLFLAYSYKVSLIENLGAKENVAATAVHNEIRGIYIFRNGFEEARYNTYRKYEEEIYTVAPIYALVSHISNETRDWETLDTDVLFLLYSLILEQVMDIFIIVLAIILIVAVALEHLILVNIFLLSFMSISVIYYMIETIKISIATTKSIYHYVYFECWAFGFHYILFWFGLLLVYWYKVALMRKLGHEGAHFHINR